MAMYTALRRAGAGATVLPQAASRAVASSYSRAFHSALSVRVLLHRETAPAVPSLRFANAFATKTDASLVQVLESDIDCALEDTDTEQHGVEIPDDFPFEIEDNPGERTIQLKRQYQDETIKVQVDIPNVAPEENEDAEEDQLAYERHLAWLCKLKKVKEAHAMYKAAIEKGKYPPMSFVSFLVGRLSHKNDTVPLALEMLRDIPGDKRKHAIQPFSAVVRALCRVNDVGAAKQLVLEMIADGPPPGNAVFNFVITRYSKLGEMGEAVEMMKLLESRGLKPDVYTYAVIASGYSNGGEMKEARKILKEAKKNHSVLSPVMFHSLVRGYCKLEQFDEALKLLTQMKDYGVRINVHEYEKLIQSLCLKATDWETAEKLQEEMKENGLYLKGINRALIRAVKEMEKEVVEA